VVFSQFQRFRIAKVTDEFVLTKSYYDVKFKPY
jgi:hypothetical protein